MLREPCINCLISLLCFSILAIIASIIVGSIGAGYYVPEKHDETVYKPTMCLVTNYTIVVSNCTRQNCHQVGFNQQCTTESYTCEWAMYTVVYNTSDGREIELDTTTTTGGPGADSVSILAEYETMKQTYKIVATGSFRRDMIGIVVHFARLTYL
jgi:hypothetical protein